MKVCIEKDPNGQLFVSIEDEAKEGMEGQSDEGQKMQAKSIEEALMMAGKILSAPDKGAGMSPFDQGVQKTMPQPVGAPERPQPMM
jgi:hypothetical protein